MYINALPDNWRDTIDADFGTICKTKLFNEKFSSPQKDIKYDENC